MSLSDIPGRAFLDTSVVNFILDYREQIHDNAPFPKNITERIALDIESLRNIFFTGERASWQFAVSPFTYKEIISCNSPLASIILKTGSLRFGIIGARLLKTIIICLIS